MVGKERFDGTAKLQAATVTLPVVAAAAAVVVEVLSLDLRDAVDVVFRKYVG